MKAIQRGADELVFQMAQQELQSVRDRKRQIAVEIFNTADFRMVA